MGLMPPLSNASVSPAQPVRVLVVDDSAFMRFSISQHLNGRDGIQVIATARDGQEALELIPALNPDVVTLDVEMPRLDGISTLREIMTRFPRPVVMLSSLTREGAVTTIQALTLGAVDFITKPDRQLDIQTVMDEAAAKIKRAANARVRPFALMRPAPPSKSTAEKPLRPLRPNEPIVVIGSSTGGPRALNEVVPALPADLPAAVVIIQHMPAGFTHSLAERLNGLSKLLVREAQPGDRLMVGQALLAPGGFHMVLDENEQIALNQNSPVHGVRPAIDVTLTSLVQRYGKRVISVILTGMGSDGTNGSVLLHSLGGTVIAEHESTCVVWGMPRSVLEKQAVDVVVPLPDVADAIQKAVRESLATSTGS
ncbi:MAG: chemotaxis response regulator protein-glutamate methylesterase [Bellilinea sp.]|nr:MAG: chemotaxis response regulator protein-glutamate methylesterase [Bellilinea sp.]